mmetsp:Transcript_71607/g.173427  ORF Transcript_71607/g.173427 Transcript_71607/m.173427 type:complete len:305 (-) Transcript_71607:69-983(-)
MAPPSMCRPRPRPILGRPHSVAWKVSMATVAVGAAVLAAAQQLAAPTPLSFALAGQGLPSLATLQRGSLGARGSVAMRAEEGEGEDEDEPQRVYQVRPWKGTSRYSSYDGYVFRKKRIPGVRLRLDRWGVSKHPFYKIKAAFQRRKANKSGRYLELVGWWDPMKEVDDPRFFSLKADRAVFWLRNGAQPTDMVANLLDRVGIIRRTGPNAKSGEWEWRIAKDSGPEAPAGWSYDGPQIVSWGNRPGIRHRKGHPHAKNFNKIPLIERYGFKGYTKIPADSDVMATPLADDTLLESFSNTELPIY